MPGYLPDINFWLALTFEAHAHHVRAAAWFEAACDRRRRCLFCRHTQQGLLRLSTNPAVFGEESLTPAEAWAAYDALRNDARIGYVSEPADVEQKWRLFTASRSSSHRTWSDAYIAAFAVRSELTVVSFDSGFGSYQDLSWLSP